MRNTPVKMINTSKSQELQTLTKSDLVNFFVNNCKSESDCSIGMEFENIPVWCSDYSQVSYYDNNGIQRLLLDFAEIYDWEKIYEGHYLIGLKKNGIGISLEPGAQIEISTSLHKNIIDIQSEVTDIEQKLTQIAGKYKFKFLQIGVSPVSTYKSIRLIPKKRYEIMSESLVGLKAKVMMRETAGIQVSVDYTSEIDAINKLRAALMISPFATAIFANSPIHFSFDTGFKSYRASAWLDTDNSRCGLVSENLFGTSFRNFTFNDYIDILLKVPLLYFVRKDNYIKLPKNFTFENFMEEGFRGHFPNMKDFLLHLNMYFPDVRLREYLEIRNHDSLPAEYKYAPGAFYKGIMYSAEAIEKVFDLFKDFTYSDFVYLRNSVPQTGLLTSVAGTSVAEYAKQLLLISKKSLENDNDSEFLENITNIINDGKSPADYTLIKYNFLL